MTIALPSRKILLLGGAVAAPFPFAPGGVLPSHDIDFTKNQAWVAGTGVVTATSLLTVTRASQETITDAGGNISYASNNAAAISNAGLQIWEARTNLLLGSADFTGANAAWSMFGATTAIAGTAPDGTTAANVTTEDTSTGQHITFGQGGNLFAASAGTSLTYSMYLKAGTRRFVWFGISDQANSYFYATVDTQNWTVTSGTAVGAVTPTVGTPVLTALANGWYRVSVTGTLPTITAYEPFVAGATASNAPIASYTGTGLTWITWGAQVEAATFVGPYIPTTSATAARALGAIVLTPPPTFGSAYSLLAWGLPSAPPGLATNQIMFTMGADATHRLVLFRSGGHGQFFMNGSASWAQIGAAAATGTLMKMAGSVAASAQNGAVNGTLGTAGTSTTVPASAAVHIGSDANATLPFNGNITRIAVWPSVALSSGTLTQLTT